MSQLTKGQKVTTPHGKGVVTRPNQHRNAQDGAFVMIQGEPFSRWCAEREITPVIDAPRRNVDAS